VKKKGNSIHFTRRYIINRLSHSICPNTTEEEFCHISSNYGLHRCPKFPLVGGLIEGFEETPLAKGK
jgi:hypothetical protein